MSCEEDEYGWDDYYVEPVVETRKVVLTVNTVSAEELETIAEGLSICLDRKLDKLNLLLGQMNVYALDGCLLVNDRYNSAPSFIETASAFGIDVKQITVAGLKGKTYVLGDRIVKLLRVLSEEYDFSRTVKIKPLPMGVCIADVPLFNYSRLDLIYGGELVSFLRQIRRRGAVSLEGTETLVDGVSQGVVSDVKRVEEMLTFFSADVRERSCENNRQLQHGTVEILRSRARQMGYTVESVENGKTVQLVLVRMD